MTSPLSYIGQVSAASSSATLPSHNAGDIVIGWGHLSGSTTPPSLPAGWTDIKNGGANSNAERLAWKISDGSTGSGTWTNATTVCFQIYRASGWTITIGGSSESGAASGNVSYGTITMTHSDGSSWVVGFAGHKQVDTALETPPSGMTNRSDRVGGSTESAGHDTNAGVSSWSTTTVAQGGTSGGWRTVVAEIVVTQLTASGSLAATESGSDTSAASGTVEVQGTLAAAESGSDTAAAAGTVLVQGTLAAAESGSDAASMAGAVLVQGSLAVAESGSDAASMAGAVLVQGSLAVAETGADTTAMAGAVLVQGTLAAAESGSDAASMAGVILVQGSLAASEAGADTAAMTGTVVAVQSYDGLPATQQWRVAARSRAWAVPSRGGRAWAVAGRGRNWSVQAP